MPETFDYYSLPNAGFSIRLSQPFLPVYDETSTNSSKKIKFNKGNVYIYGNTGQITVVPVDECETIRTIGSTETNFYAHLITGAAGTVTSARVATDANNPDGYSIKICKFDENSTLQELGLRENIHFFSPPSETTPSNFEHPFQLVQIGTTGAYTWKVNTNGSSLLDGTNGTSLTFSTWLDNQTALGKVYAWVGLNSSLEVEQGPYLEIFDGIEEEVSMAGSPAAQDKAYLFVGEVGGNAQDGFFFNQGTITAQRLDFGLHNGMPIRCFSAAPSHPNSFV